MTRIFLVPLFSGLLWAQSTEGVTVIAAGQGWLSNRRLLARGTHLIPTATVTGNADAGEVIVQCPELRMISHTCQKKPSSEPCSVPVCDTKGNGDVVSRSYGYPQQLALALLRRQPKEGATLGVRAGGNPSDAVLLEDARGIHWGPALNRVIEGSYCLRLNPLPAPARADPQIFILNWDRESDPEGVGQGRLPTPGLYALDKGKPGAGGACNVDPDDTAAWVLIAAEAQFAPQNAQWKGKATEFAQLERGGAPLSVMATLRHSVLAALADGALLR